MLKRPLRATLIAVVAVVVVGIGALWLRPLTTTVTVQRASATLKGAEYIGSVQIDDDGIAQIADGEFYVRAKVFDCQNISDYYPADLSLDGLSMDNFHAVRSAIETSNGGSSALSFSVPKNIYDRYRQHCVTLYGGQMVGFSRFKSNTVPVQ